MDVEAAVQPKTILSLVQLTLKIPIPRALKSFYVIGLCRYPFTSIARSDILSPTFSWVWGALDFQKIAALIGAQISQILLYDTSEPYEHYHMALCHAVFQNKFVHKATRNDFEAFFKQLATYQLYLKPNTRYNSKCGDRQLHIIYYYLKTKGSWWLNH